MENSEKLNQVYKLYEEKKYSEAMQAVQLILATDPQNIYAKKYEELIRPYLNKASNVGKIATVKGKSLKCPHCESSISLSALNEEQKTKIRENNYENLSLKCPYCNTNFTLQKKSFDSTIGIKIGDKITYNNKIYRTTGCVNYSGIWQEKGYSGALNYLEWILLGDDNSYLYFSEGYFLDDGYKKYEYEFSYKITPNFQIELNGDYLFINGKGTSISEKNLVEAKSLYGENSKVFTVGEKVTLLEFSFGGKDYVLEKEKAGRQSEAGIYFTESVSESSACKIFQKKQNLPLFGKGSVDNINFGNFWDFFWTAVFLIFIFSSIWQVWVVIVVFLLFYAIYRFVYVGRVFSNTFVTYLISFFFIGPIITLSFGFFILPFIFDKKTEIALQNISDGKKFEIKFQDESMKTVTEKGTTKYDYGGVRTNYSKIEGLKFSVISAEDKAIIQKIKEKGLVSEEIEKIFSQKIYQIK
ncbi:hypothetical protein HG430_002030 [Candidatus Gracilibacteria bacterium]|nr:hypothetical protein [Candidatus Gracilibacteria bacterium]